MPSEEKSASDNFIPAQAVIRHAEPKDTEAAAQLEKICFPPEEAATQEQFCERISVYGNHFLLLFYKGRLISMVNGMVTDRQDLTDDLYAEASLHSENGRWQMIFGVDTLPEYRGRGCAGTLIRRMITEARDQHRAGIVLTCRKEKIPYYSKFGFKNEGISSSVHGGAVWYQMRLKFTC